MQKILLDPDVINDEEYLNTYPEFVKQRSTLWYSLRKESRLTGSSMYNAIGLRSLKEEQKHFDSFILRKDVTPDPKLKPALDHGIKHEVTSSLIESSFQVHSKLK